MLPAETLDPVDDYEAFTIFATQQDPASALRRLNEIRAQARWADTDRFLRHSLFEGLSFPGDNNVEEEHALKSLSGRLIEEDAKQAEFFGVACYGLALRYEGFANVVGRHADVLKNRDAQMAMQRFREALVVLFLSK